MKKFVIGILIAAFAGYVWGNFGNVSDFSAEFMPNEHQYMGRGDNFRSYDDRSRDSSSAYGYHGGYGDSSYEYRGRDSSGGGDSAMDYRGRSAETGRFVHRSGRR